MEIDKEIDDGCQEVLCCMGEEIIRAAFLVATLIQGGKQGSCRLRCSCKVWYVLPLDWINAVGVFHIREIHDMESAVLRQVAVFLVLAVLVEEVLAKCRELVVIDHHGKTLGRMLPDKRIYDTE